MYIYIGERERAYVPDGKSTMVLLLANANSKKANGGRNGTEETQFTLTQRELRFFRGQ